MISIFKNYHFFTNKIQGPVLPVGSCCLKCLTTNCSDLEKIARFLCSLTKASVFLYQGTVAAYRIKQSFIQWGIKLPSFSFNPHPLQSPTLHAKCLSLCVARATCQLMYTSIIMNCTLQCISLFIINSSLFNRCNSNVMGNLVWIYFSQS